MPTATEEYSKLYSQRPKLDPSRFDQSTRQGRILFEHEKDRIEQEAKQWDKANKPVLDALQSRMQLEGKGETANQTQNDEYNKYMRSPEHDNYNLAKNLALPGAGLAGTWLNQKYGTPAAPGTTRLGRAMIATPYALEALASLEASQQAAQFAPKDPKQDPRGKDINDLTQNALYGFTTGPIVAGTRHAFANPRTKPSPDATPPASPPEPEIETYKGNPRDVMRYIAHDLEVPLGSKDSRAVAADKIQEALKVGAAPAEKAALVAKKLRGKDLLSELERLKIINKPVAYGLGALGLGAAMAGGSGEAEAAPIDSAMRAAKQQPESYSSDLSDEYGTGFPTKKAREVVKNAANQASYMLPGVGSIRTGIDVYNPSDEDLSDADYWQKGREEMARLHGRAQAPVAPEADTAKEGFKQGGTVDFDPAHLPEHERAHLDNPEAAHEKARWMYPYLRAGAEAQKRGEDFFGGSDQYERELAALKQFYHGGAVHRDDGGNVTAMDKTKPSNRTSPDDFGVGKLKGVLNKANQYDRARSGPVDQFDRLPAKKNWYGAPTGEKYEDRLTEEPKFKHGGKVTTAHEKHINSIGESFRTKLEEKKRMLSSLRKAYERSPNAKLKARIAKEEKLTSSIEKHLKNFE